MNGETIEQFISTIGWEYRRLSSSTGNAWTMRLQGEERNWELLIRLTDDWIYFWIPVLISVKPECTANIYYHLLRVNQMINMAKYILDEDNGIDIVVELPCANLQLEEVENAIRALWVYADQNYAEILSLGTNPQVQSSLRPEVR